MCASIVKDEDRQFTQMIEDDNDEFGADSWGVSNMNSISRTKRDSQWRLERLQDMNLDFVASSRDLCSSGLMLLTTMNA